MLESDTTTSQEAGQNTRIGVLVDVTGDHFTARLDALDDSAETGHVGSYLKIASDVAQVSRRTQIALSDRKAGSAVLTMSPSDFASQGIGVERITIAVHTPPWNTLPHENFFKMAELADHVLIPHSWLDAYLEARNSDSKIWLMHNSPDFVADARAEGHVTWNAQQGVVMSISSLPGVGNRHVMVPPHSLDHETMQTLLGAATILNLPPKDAVRAVEILLQEQR